MPFDKDESTAIPSNTPEYFDPKERSKERKKNVEMNRTDDKRSNAMAALKAKREGRQRREEEEAKRQAEREGNEDLSTGLYAILKNVYDENFLYGCTVMKIQNCLMNVQGLQMSNHP